MAIGLCRTNAHRNSSALTSSGSNSPTIIDVDWITNSISLLIFVLAFIGNTAALIVMFGRRGPIRLTNNKYLANLACADLLRACFMPFTIIARMKKNFMFGKMICKILPIVQGLSVAVDVFTLVCISIERYLAICRPLLILKLQSVRFANLFNACILILIWSLGLLIALPNVYIYNLCSLPTLGRFKCEKTGSQVFDERIYMIALDVFYFVIPMVVMIVLYTSIIWKMYRNSTAKKMRSFQSNTSCKTHSTSSAFHLNPFHKCFQSRSNNSDEIISKKKQISSVSKVLHLSSHPSNSRSKSATSDNDPEQKLNRTRSLTHRISCYYHNHVTKKAIRRSSAQNSSEKSCSSSSNGISRMDRHRRKALKLLITLIMEFFVCWTPLFIYHTIGTFNKTFYRSTSKGYVDLILLFSFASASCNPLTYYFMSKRYRSVLYAYLPCCFLHQNPRMFIHHKHQQVQQLIKASRSSQQLNSSERKQIEQTRINLHQNSRLRSKTLL